MDFPFVLVILLLRIGTTRTGVNVTSAFCFGCGHQNIFVLSCRPAGSCADCKSTNWRQINGQNLLACLWPKDDLFWKGSSNTPGGFKVWLALGSRTVDLFEGEKLQASVASQNNAEREKQTKMTT